jgi:glycosyltransferase involved in cell wall biosynthesis
MGNLIIAMDGRILSRPGSGIATYAAALRRAQRSISGQPLLIKDASCSDADYQEGGIGRAARWIKAGLCSDQTVHRHQDADGGGYLHAHDIYRLAQVRFRRTRRLLTLRVPMEPAIVHWSLPLPIRIADWINIYTVHDVIPLEHPDLTPMNGDRQRDLLHMLASTADHVVTVSDDARQAILRALGCAPSFVTNCSIAVEPVGRMDSSLPAPFTSGAYVLFAGSDDVRKNVARLLAAYRQSGIALQLILVGPHEAHADPEAGIFCLPHQSANDLSSLIAHARALLFPSLAEGFGLPVIEAMALGTATITSNRGALAEVAGDAALLVDPEDVGAIAEALAALVSDANLERLLVQRGRARAAIYSHEHFTRRLSALYGGLLPRLTDDR